MSVNFKVNDYKDFFNAFGSTEVSLVSGDMNGSITIEDLYYFFKKRMDDEAKEMACIYGADKVGCDILSKD